MRVISDLAGRKPQKVHSLQWLLCPSTHHRTMKNCCDTGKGLMRSALSWTLFMTFWPLIAFTGVDFRDSCFHRNSNISSVRLYTCWRSSVLISWALGVSGTEPSTQRFKFPEKHTLSAKKCQIPPTVKDLSSFKLRENYEELTQLSPFCPDISDASFCLKKAISILEFHRFYFADSSFRLFPTSIATCSFIHVFNYCTEEHLF